MKEKADILVTLDSGYICQLCIMLCSLTCSNPDLDLNVYILHSSLDDDDIRAVETAISGFGEVIPIRVAEDEFSDAPTTDRYPHEMYFRLFASEYLPENLDRVLYLDPDIIVRGDISELLNMPLGDNLIAAATHVGKAFTHLNYVRNAPHYDIHDEDEPYINSGVMVMNLKELRKLPIREDVYSFIETHKGRLFLPDQDIISGLYGSRIMILDCYRYNMTGRLFVLRKDKYPWLTIEWVKENSAIIHFCGRNKPWKQGYIGKFGECYYEAEKAYLSRIAEAE